MSRRAWSRRELLTAFLGAPLAMAACRRGEPRVPPGELVGPSVELGHRIRDLNPNELEPSEWIETSTVIVGAGIAGLAAAWRLHRAAVDDFVVLELESVPGGTSRYDTSPIVAYPWGAHYVPAPLPEDRLLIEVLTELGVVEGVDASGRPVIGEQYLCRDPEERIFYRGRWYEGLYLYAGASADDLRQLEAFKAETAHWVAWRDARGRRAFAIPIARCSDDAEVRALDRVSMADWLDARGLVSPRLRWFVEYACRDDYGTSLAGTSAWAALFYFCSRVASPGDDAQPLITWPEGNGRLVRHFAASAGQRLRTGMAVADVRVGKGGADVVAIDVAADRLVGYRASHVILATPRFMSRRLIAHYRDVGPGTVPAREYGSWMVANLFLRERPRLGRGSFPMCWDNVLYESPSLGYVVATHQTELDRGPTILTYYYPLVEDDAAAARARLLEIGRDEWATIAMEDLRSAHPDIDSLVDRVDVMRWGHAMVRPAPGSIWRLGVDEAPLSLHGRVHFAHTDMSGVALFEEALHHGVRAAEAVLSGGIGRQEHRT